jgi:hypothetical protein
MKNFYILVTSDYNEKNAYNIFKNRIKEKKFPLYLRTPNLEIIKKNDEILFYIAGKYMNAQSFVGKSIVEEIEISKEIEVDADKITNEVSRYLIFKDIEEFKEAKKIKFILNELNFIINKKHYGAYLLGGVIKISDNDFKKILKS